MTDAFYGFVGVIIGGIIASIIPFVTLIENNKRWKKEKELYYLEEKKEKLKELFDKLEEDIQKIHRGGTSNLNLYLLPEDVLFLVNKILKSAASHPADPIRNQAVAELNLLMGKKIRDIEIEIRQIVK